MSKNTGKRLRNNKKLISVSVDQFLNFIKATVSCTNIFDMLTINLGKYELNLQIYVLGRNNKRLYYILYQRIQTLIEHAFPFNYLYELLISKL